jgi:hypothetical protein
MTSTALKRESTTLATTQRHTSISTTFEPSTKLDIATVTPNAFAIATTEEPFIHPSASTTATATSISCSTDSTCANIRTGMAQAAPLGPGGNSSEPTTRMSTAAAVGVGVGVLAFILFLMGLAYWFWRRGQRPRERTIEAPPITRTRTRSESSATDQKTLVASMPNSPQNALFHGQHNEMSPDLLDQTFIAKALPLTPPTVPTKIAVPALPTPPIGRYAVNVSIDKSMIFDDVMMAASPARSSVVSRERMPRYRFEEYLPPVTRTPQLSISHVPSSQRTSDHELNPYPQSDAMSMTDAPTDDEEDDEMRSRRSRALRKLESRPPQLPSPGLPPPSPTYDWYQDIIGTEQSSTEPHIEESRTNPPKTPFGATLSPNPISTTHKPTPQPLSPYLHPRGSTASTFQLPPSVYSMPSQPQKSKSPHYSMYSTATAQTHMSRSWLPDDGLYLPEEGTHDSYMMFEKHRFGESSRPTSYSPLS